MNLLGQRILGIAILALLAILVLVKRVATGSVLDKPKGTFVVQLVNTFNLFFLLVVNPLAALLLIFRRLETADPTHVHIAQPFLTGLEIVGLAVYLLGFLVMAWALISLGGNYQLGGSRPRSEDAMVMSGPYTLVRHPMYTAALSIALGLACLTQSLACLLVFCTYFVLILFLIPVEEDGLRQVYGERYTAYQRETGRLFPSVHWFRRLGTHQEGSR